MILKGEFHDPWHQAFDSVKVLIAKGRIKIMKNGTKGRSMTADSNGLVSVFLQHCIQGCDVTSLHFSQALAVGQLIVKVLPLALAEGMKIMDPPAIHLTFPEIRYRRNLQLPDLGKIRQGIHGPLIGTGQQYIHAFVQQIDGDQLAVLETLFRQFS